MAKRAGRRVFLGVQWDCGSWDNLPRLIERLIEKAGNRPLVWNIPALPSDNPRKTRTWVEKTIGPRVATDTIAAMGFAGACHPLLTLDELAKEISWGVENPWGTGIKDVLGIRPEVIIPRVPDLQRADALKAYAGHGFTTLGISCNRRFAWTSIDGLACFTCRRMSVADSLRRPRTPGLLKALMAPAGDVLLVLDLGRAATVEALAEVMEKSIDPWLAPESVPSPLAADHEAATDARSVAVNGLDWSSFPDPLLRKAIAANAGSAKRKRKKTEEYRDLLMGFALASAGAAADESPPLPREGDMRLVAQMLGEVSLSGSLFDVRLAGGRFAGIRRAGHDCLPARPARSYLRVSGRPLTFLTRNSFSFERDEGTGLREVLAIDSRQESSLAIEYSFCEGSPDLEVTAEMRWPDLAPESVVEEHVPFAISLRELQRGEEALVESVAPDGSNISVRISGGNWVVIPAAVHRVPLGDGSTLRLSPGPADGRGWSLASFRVARAGRRRFLEANPFGGWFPLPAGALSGKRESFRLLLGIEDGGGAGKQV